MQISITYATTVAALGGATCRIDPNDAQAAIDRICPRKARPEHVANVPCRRAGVAASHAEMESKASRLQLVSLRGKPDARTQARASNPHEPAPRYNPDVKRRIAFFESMTSGWSAPPRRSADRPGMTGVRFEPLDSLRTGPGLDTHKPQTTRVDGMAARKASPACAADIPPHRPSAKLLWRDSRHPLRIPHPPGQSEPSQSSRESRDADIDAAITPVRSRALVSKQGRQISDFLGFNARATGESACRREM